MTRFLASVNGPEEAEIALEGGADVIDLKDPSRGALGAVAIEVVRATVGCMAGRRQTSAVTGDLPMDPGRVLGAATEAADAGVDYVKVGMFPDGEPAACVTALAMLARRQKLVAVFFADARPELDLLDDLSRAGFAGAMLDTRGKAQGRLLDHMELPRLRDFVVRCRDLRLMTGLAGSLEPPDIPRLLLLAPDLLGFRGALTGAGGRAGAIALARVREIRALIPSDNRAARERGADIRLLARGYAPGAEVATDTVFVRDLVLPVFIGAYARERDAPQRVRFDVDVAIVRASRTVEDMRDVFSYDVVTDGIRLLVDAGHIALVETLAERIAALVLEHPRVVRVGVRLQKLDTGMGSVGVAIERSRAVARASKSEIVAFPAGTSGP